MKITNAQLRPALASALLAMTALAACNTANTAKSGFNGAPYKQIITNGWLKYKANIVGVHEGTVNGDIKRIAVDVYSDQLTPQRFTYKFEWFDASGIPVANPSTTSTSVTIKPKETITLTSVAPAPTATDWRLTFLDEQR